MYGGLAFVFALATFLTYQCPPAFFAWFHSRSAFPYKTVTVAALSRSASSVTIFCSLHLPMLTVSAAVPDITMTRGDHGFRDYIFWTVNTVGGVFPSSLRVPSLLLASVRISTYNDLTAASNK